MSAIWKSDEGRRAVEARYRAILQFWPVPSVQRTVPTRHGETFVVSSGPDEAPSLVVLHGSASNSFMWMGDVALWAKDFRVHCVDIIGEPGLSSPQRPTLASGAYPLWLDDVLEGLRIEKTALVGLSLGGYLVLDYATRRPQRVSAVVALCPGGVGRHRNVLLWAAPLLLLGAWGRRKVQARILGPAKPGAPQMPDAVRAFIDLIHANFNVRRERIPAIADAALARLTMPVLAILGGKDAMIDSAGTRRRLEARARRVTVDWRAEDGHFLRGYGPRIAAFLDAQRN